MNVINSVDTEVAGGEFEADLDRRFGGLARLYGIVGARRIRAAHVVIVGIGGVGSWAAEAVARSGVARITLVDLDHIAESNVNRQAHALSTTLGQAKVQAMRERIALINPACQVDGVEEFVEPGNWPDMLGMGDDLQTAVREKRLAVIDACDQVKAKTAMAAWALRHKVVMISVGAAGGKRLAHKVDIEDLALVTHDPLLAQLRYRLRKEHGGARKGNIGVACVFSREPVMQADALLALNARQSPDDAEPAGASEAAATVEQTDGSLNCHGYGSVVAVTASFGFCAAGWVLGKLAGQ